MYTPPGTPRGRPGPRPRPKGRGRIPSVSPRVEALGQLRRVALDAFSFALLETRAGTLRLMQWNLKDFTDGASSKGGPTWSLWAERLDNIVETILAHVPDVVTLQELRMLHKENSAFAQLQQRLVGHGYDGTFAADVGPLSGGYLSAQKREGLGFLWRKAAVSLDPEHDVVALGRGKDGDTGQVTSKTLGGLAAGLGFEPGAEGAPVSDWLEAWGGAGGHFGYAPAVATFRRVGDGRKERGGSTSGVAELAPVLLRVLTVHLHTKKVGNERECALLRAVARGAWAAGEPLVVMGDTNTDMASNPAAGSELVGGHDPVAKNAVGPHLATNVFPFVANAADDPPEEGSNGPAQRRHPRPGAGRRRAPPELRPGCAPDGASPRRPPPFRVHDQELPDRLRTEGARLKRATI